MKDVFARTCQECGHIQASQPPGEELTDAYRNAKCRKCRSAALDYGNTAFEHDAAGKLVRSEGNDWTEE